MIRLACPLWAVGSPKYDTAFKVVQMPVCNNWFQRDIFSHHVYFPYGNHIIQLTGEGFITSSTESNKFAPYRLHVCVYCELIEFDVSFVYDDLTVPLEAEFVRPNLIG